MLQYSIETLDREDFEVSSIALENTIPSSKRFARLPSVDNNNGNAGPSCWNDQQLRAHGKKGHSVQNAITEEREQQIQRKEQRKCGYNSILYLEGCILGVDAPEVVKYYSDIDLAPELYNLCNPLYYLCNISARPAPSPIYGPTYPPSYTRSATRAQLSISRPLQINLPP